MINPISMPDWLAQTDATQRWIIEGLVSAEAITLVSGARKLARKTLLVNDLVMRIATGTPFFVANAAAIKVAQSPVLYCEEEGPPAGTKVRWLAQIKGAGLEVPQLKELYFSHRVGLKLDTPDRAEQIVRFCDSVGAKVVALDPFGYLFNGDENKSADVKYPLEVIREIRNTGRTVILVHHAGKSGGDAKLDIDDRLRGSSMVADVYDNHLALTGKSYSPIVQCDTRHRDGEETRWELTWMFKGNEQISLSASKIAGGA